MSSLLTTSFFLLTLVNLLSVLFDWKTGIYLSKPLLMPMLAVWFYFRTRAVTHRSIGYIISGLLFSTAGDSFLMLTDYYSHFFLLGLASFLITHLFYILAYISFRNVGNGLLVTQPYWVLPIIGYLIFLLHYLWEGLPAGLRFPVITYSTVISLMWLASLHTYKRIPDQVAGILVLGSLLFVLSDSLIALHTFASFGNNSPRLVSFLIMSTYLAGQYMIVRSSLSGIIHEVTHN